MCHRAAILRRRLIIRGFRRQFLVQQGAAMKQRLRDGAGRGPEAEARREQLIDRQRRAEPMSPVSVMFGKRLAMATPIWALADCRLASAARTSGRCSTSFDGRLKGRSRGSRNAASENFSGIRSLGKPPINAASRSRCCANCFCSGGKRLLDLRQRRFLRHHVALGDLAELELLPHHRSTSVSILMMLCVAAIWPRSDASCTAAPARLEVKVR